MVLLQSGTRLAPASDLAQVRSAIARDPAHALDMACAILRRDPRLGEAHRLAALALRALGRVQDAQRADLASAQAAPHDAELMQAARAMVANALHLAEPILKRRLREQPTDIAAMRLLAELAARIGRLEDAESLLHRALDLAPEYGMARANLATVLFKQNNFAQCLAELDRLPAGQDTSAHASLRAAALARTGGFEEALSLYRQLARRMPEHAPVRLSMGHVLKTLGRTDEAIAAYRAATAIDPALGEAWWSMANLKTLHLGTDDIATMTDLLGKTDLPDDSRFHLEFALGKAYADQAAWAASYCHYAAANAGRRARLPHDADAVSAQVDTVIARCTAEAFAARADRGCPAHDPVFIVGMPRAGSTLLEQILASHSSVEGTMELPDLPILARTVAGGLDDGPAAWVCALLDADPETLHALGAEYIARTRMQRKTDRPFFIDKLPNNWIFVALIRLILPNARIIDARRNPMDCGFSNFCQHFARGQAFSYDLADIGRYYADYVRLMRHVDRVQPGLVHRVIHEDLLDDPECESRRLLAYLGLPFEPACLRFHENARPVRTASSEQVRKPINRDGVGRWHPYSDWLNPLRHGLGDTLNDWR
jgi:tetratricopeptide (TPR) repeat protein